jgi:hypothetical protein
MPPSPKPLLSALTLAFVGCSTTFGEKTTEGDDTGEASIPDDAGTVDALTDLTDDLDTSGCDDVDGYPVPGAAGYFAGSYAKISDGEWRGAEQWLLFANDTWVEYDGHDCTITWSVVASESDSTGACAACDLGLEISATIDLGNTDCPEALYEGEENWTTGYGIMRSSDGTAQWFYQATGTPLGAGDYGNGTLEFLSDKSCNWF